MSHEEDETGSQGLNSLIDEILDQYRFNWEPDYRVKFKKELAGVKVGLCASKPHRADLRLRITLKPSHRPSHADDHDTLDRPAIGTSAPSIPSSSLPSSSSCSSSLPSSSSPAHHCGGGWRRWLSPGRLVHKVLVLPQQRFAALYSPKLAWGFLRCQFVAGYFFDRHRPSLDYRLSTKWSDGFRIKRKEYYHLTDNLLLRAKWALDMQLPEVDGHLGGLEGAPQVPVDVEYGSLDFSVTQLDWVCDLDGFPERRRAAAALVKSAAAPAPAPAPKPAAAPALPGWQPGGRITWPWEAR